MADPVVPSIDDNVRLMTKAYREKIYDDIDHRYSTLPFRDRINEYRSLSSKKDKERDSRYRDSSKRRPLSVKK